MNSNAPIFLPLCFILCLLCCFGCGREDSRVHQTTSAAAPSPELTVESRHTADEAAPRTAGGVNGECRWTHSPVVIDGIADEIDWSHAQLLSQFGQPWEKTPPDSTDGSPAPRTAARLMWDREYLYFYAEMIDTDLYADEQQHDGNVMENDAFVLLVKPAEDKTGFYEFGVNPANAVLDMFIPRRGSGRFERYKGDRPFNITTAVTLRGSLNRWQDKDKGWSVEGRIPWRDFLPTGGRPAPGETWKCALGRIDYSVDIDGPELTSTAGLTRPDLQRVEEYTSLRFAAPDETATGVPYGIAKRIPWNDSKIIGTPGPPPPFTLRRTFEKLTVANPIHIHHEPGTTNLLVTHQLWFWSGWGRVLRISEDPNVSEAQELIAADPGRIIYGLAFDPQYEKNGYLYVGSNGTDAGGTGKATRVMRHTVDRKPPHALIPDSGLLIIEWPSDGHNGGDLAFGPDGLLYVSSGDGSSDSDMNHAGQDLSKLNAKLLRIDVRRSEAGKPYEVPADNPYVGLADTRPETWAYGFRNPWRICFDQKRGDLWAGNNGQDLWEQVYRVAKGANYGWSIQEGSHPFYPERKRGPHPITPPTFELSHSQSHSLTGGQVYYGQDFPELNGMYIFGDWSTGKVWALKHDGNQVVEHLELADTTLRVIGFGFDSRGELLIVDHYGGFYRLERAAKTQRPPFPTKLSETGLFASVPGHIPHAAAIPFDVNAQQWSDGAVKERFFLLPGAESRITYPTERGWDFPDGTVVVQSLALETEPGNAKTRRWVETRLLTRQVSKWVGYSYAWTEEQNDATLVQADGLDRDFMINDPTVGGIRKQTWHYPSRTQCMVCHSRVANYLLGLTELQMNRTFTYGDVTDNQLRTLEHLNLFSVRWLDHERQAVQAEMRARGDSDAQINDFLSQISATRLQREPVLSAILPRPPGQGEHLVDPYDTTQDLQARARSYLQANCAQCHVMFGGGNTVMELEFGRSLAMMNTIDAKPMHDNFGIPDARLVAAGDPGRSVMLQRVAKRGTGQMPPLGTSQVDTEAINLLVAWIATLSPPPAEK